MAHTILHDVLAAGVEEGASDWHIREGRPVSLRISGSLAELDVTTDRKFLLQAIEQICTDQQKQRFQEIGDTDFAFMEDGLGRFRANLHRQRNGIAVTLRYVKERVAPIDELKLPRKIHELAESQRGIIFVTGITGAGKSTTLASMLEHVNEQQTRHIITIEDPIEYSFRDNNSVIEQREVGLDTGSFDSALVHVLRQDPDVVVIGEMRDKMTFETALTAAETGHLVLTTLHTTNAPQSLNRILDMYNQQERESIRKSLSGNLRAIICQRLIQRASGKGQVPAVEIMINTPIVQKLIAEGRFDKLPGAIDAGAEEGMISFNRSLLKLIQDGTIREEDGLAASNNAEALRMNLSGIYLNSDKGSIVSTE